MPMSLTHFFNTTARLSLTPNFNLFPSATYVPRSLFLTSITSNSKAFSPLSARVSQSPYSSKTAMGDAPDAGMDAVQRRLMFEDE